MTVPFDTPAADRPPLDLDAIRAVDEFDLFAAARTLDNSPYADALGKHRGEVLTLILQAVDLPRLKAEVTALRAELDAARAEAEDNAGIARVVLDDAARAGWVKGPDDNDGIDWGDHPPHPAARAERTEPATGCWCCNGTGWDETRHFVDQPAEAHPCGYCGGSGSTAPVTGEEEEVRTIAMVLLRQYDAQYDASHLTWEHFIPEATQIAAALDVPALRAAALDLPGREQALREERDDAVARLMRARERRRELRAERDAANAALADVARLLDEAREERDKARAEVAAVLDLMDFLEGLDSIVGYDEVRRLLTDRRRNAESWAEHRGGKGGGS